MAQSLKSLTLGFGSGLVLRGWVLWHPALSWGCLPEILSLSSAPPWCACMHAHSLSLQQINHFEKEFINTFGFLIQGTGKNSWEKKNSHYSWQGCKLAQYFFFFFNF